MSRTLKYLPLIMAEVYLAMTAILFFFGPFDWPRVDFGLLFAFLALYQVALAVGYYLGARGSIKTRSEIDPNYWFKASLIVSIFLIVPYAYIYTGSFPWDIVRGVPDQAQAFAEYYQRLASDRTPERITVMIARTIFSPLMVALLPLVFWTRRLGFGWKVLFVVYVLMYFSFSLLRGTDKESGDFFVYMVVGWLSRVGAERYARRAEPRKSRILPVVIILSLVAWFSYTTFLDRKLARLGGDETICIQQADVCADSGTGVMPYLSERNQFGVGMAALYLSIGYYGMGLALEEDFESTIGLGHSVFVSGLLTKFQSVAPFFERSYTAKVSDRGWDALVYWVTTYTWLANDIGFIGVVFFMTILGFVFSRAWHDVVTSKNIAAIVILPQIVLMIFYLPAFNVTMQNVDNYFAFIFWLIIWMGRVRFASRSRRRQCSNTGVAT